MYARLFFLVADLSTSLLLKERAHGLEPRAGRTWHTLERLAEVIPISEYAGYLGKPGGAEMYSQISR